jgi:two-component system, cell cycle sensor histidine kinase and response regulator CckA
MKDECVSRETEVLPAATTREVPIVLVVDDDATVRTMAEHHLATAGYRVVTLADGEDVLTTFDAVSPDAVLLDVLLPDCDGFSLCRALRARSEAEHTPVVMLTSLNDEESIREAFEAGATEFVPKPVNWVNEAYRLRYLMRAARTMQDLDSANEAVSRGKKEWEQTFASIEDPILLMGPDLTVRRANAAAARLAQCSLDEIIGKQCPDVFQCSDANSVTCCAGAALASRKPVRSEIRECGPGKRNCLASAAPLFNGSSQPIGVVYSLKDVTDYRELEREFLHAQKMEALGVLAGGIAHDFNNLLQGIRGFTELLAMDGQSFEEIQNGLEEIRKMADRGRGLTRQLLLSARKSSAPLGALDVGQVLRDTVGMLERTITKTIKTEMTTSSDLWPVKGDASHLGQALMNLAINAAHAMPEGGDLCMQATNVTLDAPYITEHPGCHSGSHVMIAVSDTGCGMDPETMEKMYEPFFTTKTHDKGTGLGLSVVYGIVREHGGHICCYSEPGKGTTFRIYIPATADRVPQTSATYGEGMEAPPGAGQTILVVEDEPMLQHLLQQFLTRGGYRVIQAGDGIEALEQYAAHADGIDAIVMDMNMPRMNGEACMKELHARGCRAPIILATGTLFSSERQAALLRRAERIVTKPFNMQALIGYVAEVLV